LLKDLVKSKEERLNRKKRIITFGSTKTKKIKTGSISVSVMRENILSGKGEQRRFPSIRSPWWRVGGSLARRDGNRRYDG